MKKSFRKHKEKLVRENKKVEGPSGPSTLYLGALAPQRAEESVMKDPEPHL